MEYGSIPKLNQFVDNNSVEIQRVQSSKESSEIKKKDVVKLLKQTEERLQNTTLDEKNLQDSFTNTKKEFDEIKEQFDLKDKEYKDLEAQTSSFNQKETNNRDRLKSIEKLIISIDEYKRLLESILKEENIISSSKDESKIIKINIKKKT